jgi:hypothetical protein
MMILMVGVLALGPTALPVPASAGTTTAVSQNEVHQELYRLYAAYFLREPDSEGMQFWTAHRLAGMSLAEVSSRFAGSREFHLRYGSLSDAQFVERVYRNLFDRAPDPEGRQHWTNLLAHGMTRGQMMLHVSDSVEFRRATAGDAMPEPARPAPEPESTPEPAPADPSPSPGTSGGGLAPVASNVDVANWLVAPWDPNPDPGYPAFRMFCEFSHLGTYDPIVDPGNDRFMHLHMFFGNTAVGPNSTYQSLRSSGDSTCDGGPLNRTAYWMPAVFDQHDQVVVPDYFELYYKAENADTPRNVKPYPNGLRMIAGAPDNRVWGWSCEGSSASSTTIPDCPDGERLTVSVRFPYCWDGTNLDAPDHRSHMAYGTNNTWGPCPASHPVHLPEITEFAHFENASGSSQWHLSSDHMNPTDPAPNGSTFHADWFGAWDNDIQDRWVTHCLHGELSTSNGNLCDGQQLRPADPYPGPHRIPGWTPTP